jgi:DNA repair ATPase RecN
LYIVGGDFSGSFSFNDATTERREEIASMPPGAEITDEARAQADRLLVA